MNCKAYKNRLIYAQQAFLEVNMNVEVPKKRQTKQSVYIAFLREIVDYSLYFASSFTKYRNSFENDQRNFFDACCSCDINIFLASRNLHAKRINNSPRYHDKCSACIQNHFQILNFSTN